MGPITADWKIKKGTQYTKTITVRDKVTKKPINITGYKFYFTIKTGLSVADGSATLQQNWTSHTSPTEGITTWTLTETESNALTAGNYIFDFVFIDAGGIKGEPFLEGNLEVVTPVTQAVS